MNFLDVTISVVVVLFILSIVTEKFTQLIRGYPLFFNAISLVLSVVFIWQGIACFLWPPSGNGENYPLIAIAIFLLSFLVFFIKSGSRYSVLPFPVFVISNLLVAMYAYSYVMYFLVGSLVGYLCLVGLKLLPEYRIRVSDKTFTTNLLKRVRSTNKSPILIRDADKKNEIHVLSLIVGIIIAYLFKADFFELIKNFSKSNDVSLQVKLGWDSFPISFEKKHFKFEYEDDDFNFYFTLGILLTGFFLSFGSRFFHDLLETLFYAKKAKHALADKETYKINDVQKLEEWVKEYDIEKFYYREKHRISGQFDLLGIGIGTVRSNGETISGLRLYGTGTNRLVSERFEVDGRVIPHEVVKMDMPVVSIVETRTISFADGITNIEAGHGVGSITCAVQASRRDINWTGTCLLTCYHVVKHKRHHWDHIGSDEFAYASLGQSPPARIGEIVAACRTPYVEIALIALNEVHEFIAKPYALGIKETRHVDKKDEGRGVYHYSRIDGGKKRQGIIKAYKAEIPIDFKDTKEGFPMEELIEVQQSNSAAGPIQKEGDSGNVLFDENGWPIGIIFAKSAKSTFAMQMQHVVWRFDNMGYTIKLL